MTDRMASKNGGIGTGNTTSQAGGVMVENKYEEEELVYEKYLKEELYYDKPSLSKEDFLGEALSGSGKLSQEEYEKIYDDATTRGYEVIGHDSKHIVLRKDNQIIRFQDEFVDYLNKNTDWEVNKILDYMDSLPRIFKVYGGVVDFLDETGNGYGVTPNGSPGKNAIYIGKDTFYPSKKDTFYNPQQTILHEFTHRLDHRGKSSTWSGYISEHPYFRLLSSQWMSSGYSQYVHHDYPPHYLTENLSEATMMALARNMDNRYTTFVEPANGKRFQNMSYDDWQFINPELDEVANVVYTSRSSRQIQDYLDSKLVEWQRNNPELNYKDFID